ncbi:MAG TPA: type II toxin-antitoxin system RelE/ParE family toxin [Rhizomicrobium sp.]|jgi:phage-related protein|nr:type II toxin-antitoxin system RelE/ParE family toxin [Rhizomicrobium sp.]
MRGLRPVIWIGASKKGFLAFPARVQDDLGYELFLVQKGGYPPHAKPLKGMGGGVLELAMEFDGDAYRAVYTVRFAEAVYVLHAFKKKSKHGIATPASDIALIKRRLADAADDYKNRFGQEA